jgi:succinate-acetate transporter protein
MKQSTKNYLGLFLFLWGIFATPLIFNHVNPWLAFANIILSIYFLLKLIS